MAKFGEAVEHVPVGSIAAVFEEVNRRHVQFGIVPLENSTDGRIADTLDMFIKLPNLKIRAEVRLRIHHCLLGRCEWGQVRRVYSKSQALSQCRNWLGKNLPQAAKVEVVSTAAAAELAQREEFAAAVASRAAAQAYRLNILAENIEDQAHNVTRFAVIAEVAEERTGKDKTTLMIRLPNQAGSLVKTDRSVREVRRQHDLDRVVPSARTRRARATPLTCSSSTSRATSTTPRSRRPSRPSARGASGSTSWVPIRGANASRPESRRRSDPLGGLLHLLHDPVDHVGHRRIDPQTFELGRDLPAMVGGVIDDVPQHRPGRKHDRATPAAEGPGRRQHLRRERGGDLFEDRVSTIEQASASSTVAISVSAGKL